MGEPSVQGGDHCAGRARRLQSTPGPCTAPSAQSGLCQVMEPSTGRGKKAVWELWARLCKQMDEAGGWQEEGDCGKGSRARQCPCSSRNKMAREATPPPQGARLLLLMLTKIKNCIDRHEQTCPSPQHKLITHSVPLCTLNASLLSVSPRWHGGMCVCAELCRLGFPGRWLKLLTRKTGQRTQKAVLLRCVPAHPRPKAPPSQLSHQHSAPVQGGRQLQSAHPHRPLYSSPCRNETPELT